MLGAILSSMTWGYKKSDFNPRAPCPSPAGSCVDNPWVEWIEIRSYGGRELTKKVRKSKGRFRLQDATEQSPGASRNHPTPVVPDQIFVWTCHFLEKVQVQATCRWGFAQEWDKEMAGHVNCEKRKLSSHWWSDYFHLLLHGFGAEDSDGVDPHYWTG